MPRTTRESIARWLDAAQAIARFWLFMQTSLCLLAWTRIVAAVVPTFPWPESDMFIDVWTSILTATIVYACTMHGGAGRTAGRPASRRA